MVYKVCHSVCQNCVPHPDPIYIYIYQLVKMNITPTPVNCLSKINPIS